MKKKDVLTLVYLLDKEFPFPVIELNYKSDIELLIAVILSAQCTDKRVNKTTADLFVKYISLNDYLNVEEEEFANDIKSCGFYKTKGKNILAALEMIKKQFNSKIPNNMDALLKLPGVGRKTANLMLGELYGKQTIVVDTHVLRVSGRLSLTKSKNPQQVEKDLQKILPKELWSRKAHQVLLHGRYICTARKPDCSSCLIYDICTWDGKQEKG